MSNAYDMEKLWLVDETDQVIGETFRHIADVDTQAIHREVGIIIIRPSDGTAYFQKRSSNKKVLPNVWSTGCVGHVTYGLTARQAGVTELKEELDVDVTPEQLQYVGKELTHRPNETHFKYWYVLEVGDDFEPTLSTDEVAEARFLSLDEVKQMIQSGEEFYPPYLDIVAKYFSGDTDQLIKVEEPENESHS